ncbi:hypothetical protein B0T25DRAFT_563746 [Lasiosphaeria hispida]|uniref:Glucose-methanol-choline oxidoreductase C-terminal domain-containing protein n=1 Tax=Lasiosphaeria hispida TaxID=260671 RepID=A0AAJ0MGY1_9PEZI|nr:hypothetical protein B0T25DRAFT_563746 [Lasiosphaeria hispida]
MAFCQIVLGRDIVKLVKENPHNFKWWDDKVMEHEKMCPSDPVPIPPGDLDPHCYYPLSEEHPWHCQIHRDSFGYGEVPGQIDQRLIVDFRWFGYVKPEEHNCVEFSETIRDGFGMPQPTFSFTINDEDAERCAEMITDMAVVARKLGGFLPGAEPKYLAPGSALHICGTYRAGESVKDSVVDRFGVVYGHPDLVLGGCGVIPT